MPAYTCWFPDLDETAADGSVINANSPWHAAAEYARLHSDAISHFDGAAIAVRDPYGKILTFDAAPDGSIDGRMGGDELWLVSGSSRKWSATRRSGSGATA